jgi:hypothetical protein
MPLQATSGAASYDAFGGGVPVVPQYIEDVFSTYLYAGSSSNKTIVNGINLSEKGGLVWMKSRIDYTTTGYNHALYDTARGNLSRLSSNTTSAADTGSGSTYMSSFNNNGFTLVGNGFYENYSPDMVSWTFRKQPKFFDVVTWTGTGANRTIAHALNSEVGFIVVKRTDASSTWVDYHRGFPSANYYSQFGTTGASYYSDSTVWNDTAPTSSVFSLGSSSLVNASGGTYVAYLFAHNAGGFGLNGTDNVIVCGTADTAWSNIAVDCGFEPQFVMARVYERTGPWRIFDNMRGVAVNGNDAMLRVDQSYAEDVTTDFIDFTSTGFVAKSELVYSGKLFYIAIRRGPMKVPTDGTKVFASIARTGTGTPVTVTGIGFTPDASIAGPRGSGYTKFMATSRLLNNLLLTTSSTAAGYPDTSVYPANIYAVMDGINQGGTGGLINGSGNQDINWFFKRASGFFDVVCYIGTGSATTVAHNLGVAPELILFKARGGGTADWRVYVSPSTNLLLNTTDSIQTDTVMWNNTAPTSTVFSLGPSRADVNESARNYVSYLFATCAGVSKVGSYTGNGSSQTINCGFTGGARFVLIKKTSGTGDWMVSDSARGIVSGNDPYLELNNTNAEVTGEDWLDTDSTGFVVNEVSGSNANTSSATYIFLAIA